MNGEKLKSSCYCKTDGEKDVAKIATKEIKQRNGSSDRTDNRFIHNKGKEEEIKLELVMAK